MTISEHCYSECLEAFRNMTYDDKSLAIFTMLTDIEDSVKDDTVCYLLNKMKSLLLDVDEAVTV